MNIELKFLEKAINDKNFVSFSYENKNLKRVKPLKLVKNDEKYILHSDVGDFDFAYVNKFKVLKDRF